MLDFDYWLGDGEDNAVDQRDGILLMERIAIVTGGALLPLVASNPRGEVEGGGKAFERVREAVEQRGFVGVKLYPPNGFVPFGNPSAHGSRAVLRRARRARERRTGAGSTTSTSGTEFPSRSG